MENKNVLTINFNNTEDLALQIAEWNYILNHQCCGNCHGDETHAETACEIIDVEVEKNKVEPKVVKVKNDEEKATNKTVKVEQKQDVPVTDFECKPKKPKNEEKVKPVAEPESAEATKAEEPAPVDTELDVATEPVDKKAFYKEFREWMGTDATKAKKAISIFAKHGVNRPSSDVLTDDIITDLKSIMTEEA